MGRYVGTMPTRLLNDQQIRPGSYPTWDHVRSDFERHSKDREALAELQKSIPIHGQRAPILLGVDDRSHEVYVSDGHHRSLALIQLDIAQFTFRWCWLRAWSVDHQREPFPYHLLGL